MASITTEVVFKSGEYRPCVVKTTDEKGLFHRWCDYNGMTIALVEFEDGHVAQVNPKNIQFLDSRYVFRTIDFGEVRDE